MFVVRGKKTISKLCLSFPTVSKISFGGVSEETLILLDLIWFDQFEEFNVKERANTSWNETSEEKKA